MTHSLETKLKLDEIPVEPPYRIEGERRKSDAARIAEQLQEHSRVHLLVRGSSMQPWVRPGDIALIRRAGIEEVRCGDVVLFQREDRLFVHRLVEKRGTLRESEFLAKGDAHPGSDGVITDQLILGRVTCIYRGDKRIDLDSPRQLALGLMVSQLSRKSAYWYPVARTAAMAALAVRRFFSFGRASSEASN